MLSRVQITLLLYSASAADDHWPAQIGLVHPQAAGGCLDGVDKALQQVEQRIGEGNEEGQVFEGANARRTIGVTWPGGAGETLVGLADLAIGAVISAMKAVALRLPTIPDMDSCQISRTLSTAPSFQGCSHETYSANYTPFLGECQTGGIT